MADRVVFWAGGRSFTRSQAVCAAESWDGVGQARDQASLGLACQRYAEDEGFDLDAGLLESMADAYRSAHDLTTAEDTERFLDDHDLTLDDFSSWLERDRWRERFAADRALITRDYPSDPTEVHDLLWPELVFGGHLAGVVRAFAERIAVRLASGPVSDLGWADDVAGIERLYGDKRREVTGPANVAGELAAHRTSLVRFVAQVATFATAGAAREGWLCTVEEGEPLPDVARRASASLHEARLFVDQFPEHLRPIVLAGLPGDVMPPAPDGDAWVVCRIVEKRDPDLEDAEVRSRIESLLLARTFDDLILQHVRWA